MALYPRRYNSSALRGPPTVLLFVVSFLSLSTYFIHSSVGAFHGHLPYVANIDNRPATDYRGRISPVASRVYLLLHSNGDLQNSIVASRLSMFATHHTTLVTHVNPLLKTLLVRGENRRLKRNWSIDVI
jgi:hypothetical protein